MKNFKFDVNVICSIFSGISLLVVLVSCTCLLIYKTQIFDTIAGVALAAMFAPFLITIVTLTAGVAGPFIDIDDRRPKVWSWVFYLIMFPFVCMWTFTGVNGLFEIIPSHHLVNGILRRGYDHHEAMFYAGSLYVILITAGLIWRALRNRYQLA